MFCLFNQSLGFWIMYISKTTRNTLLDFKALVERAKFIMDINIAASFFIHDISNGVDCCDSSSAQEPWSLYLGKEMY